MRGVGERMQANLVSCRSMCVCFLNSACSPCVCFVMSKPIHGCPPRPMGEERSLDQRHNFVLSGCLGRASAFSDHHCEERGHELEMLRLTMRT